MNILNKKQKKCKNKYLSLHFQPLFPSFYVVFISDDISSSVSGRQVPVASSPR